MPANEDAEATTVGRPVGLVARIALQGLRAYKVLLSPLFAGACRFTPSCADYTAEAIERHGALWGMLLGARRLARCRPFGSCGFDPVPLKTPHFRVRRPMSAPRQARGVVSLPNHEVRSRPRTSDTGHRTHFGPATPRRAARMQ